MRARLIFIDDTTEEVVQSLDMPMPPEPGGRVRVPGTTIMALLQFLMDEQTLASRGYLNDMAVAISAWARGKGFWDADIETNGHVIPAKIALIHAEVSEALEAYRSLPEREGDAVGLAEVIFDEEHAIDGMPKPDGFPIELADIIIRVLDLAGRTGVDIDGAVAAKRAYNEVRPHRHGKRL